MILGLPIALMVVGGILSIIAGLVVAVGLNAAGSRYRISLIEFIVCSAALLVIVAPAVALVGSKLSVDNLLEYHENLNGYELTAINQVFYCHESDVEGGDTGGCTRTYNADRYTVQVPYTEKVVDHAAYTDSKGRYHSEVSHTVTKCCKTETRYRQVPYTQQEVTWVIHTTLGDFTPGDHWLQADPDNHRIAPQHDVMQSYGSLPSGIPTAWAQAKQRIDSGDPGPVTVRSNYVNYILASQWTTLKKNSGLIDSLNAAKLLPAFNSTIHDFYLEDRVYFVGLLPPPGDWQQAINRFDAALGTGLQGDLHLVIADSNKVGDPDEYLQALMAYWQTSGTFGKDSASKNVLVVVLGTADGQTIAWARGATGMPRGNEGMLNEIMNLKGTVLTPEAVLGRTRGEPYVDPNGKTKVRIINTVPQGSLEQIIWGANKFQRQHMTCKGADGTTTLCYDYLRDEVQPTAEQNNIILFVTLIFSAVVWGIAAYVGLPSMRR